jgi:cobalamin biosynthesis protein CobD/CbiB
LLLIAVAVLTLMAFAIDRLAGIPYALWNPPAWNGNNVPVPGESTL